MYVQKQKKKQKVASRHNFPDVTAIFYCTILETNGNNNFAARTSYVLQVLMIATIAKQKTSNAYIFKKNLFLTSTHSDNAN
jgi:hypothetical protein